MFKTELIKKMDHITWTEMQIEIDIHSIVIFITYVLNAYTLID